jgi:glycine/D-amino acid oxidase-like deaminating enzyme
MSSLPQSTGWLIIGAGFAGASTAWALTRAGQSHGLLLEQEESYGVHASGRNAGMARLAEDDALIRTLAIRSIRQIRSMDVDRTLLDPTGGLTLVGAAAAPALEHEQAALRAAGVRTELLTVGQALDRIPFLRAFEFHAALWCPDEAVVDVHALLMRYIQEARLGGFETETSCRVDDLLLEAGRVVGVRTSRGEVRAEMVVDASGAWAGRLGRGAQPLPLRPLRRHLFVSAPVAGVTQGMPYAWIEDAGFYYRREGDGLLLSPCDESPASPGIPTVDQAAAELLAEKMDRVAPGLGDVSLRRSWACLRTFAPDRHPLIGADPDLPGLFHVSGLGGFGMMTSAAVGELAATVLTGGTPDWVDAAAVNPARASVRRT